MTSLKQFSRIPYHNTCIENRENSLVADIHYFNSIIKIAWSSKVTDNHIMNYSCPLKILRLPVVIAQLTSLLYNIF